MKRKAILLKDKFREIQCLRSRGPESNPSAKGQRGSKGSFPSLLSVV